MKLAVVIVNYRTPALVVDCLASLMAEDGMPLDTRIVVVEGGSEDGSADVIGTAIAAGGWSVRVNLLALSTNRGFSFGNNQGVRYLRERFGEPDHVLFLNPDTVVRPGALRHLVEFLEENANAGVVGSRLEDPDGTAQACAFRFPSPLAEFESEASLGPLSRILRRWNVCYPETSRPLQVDWVSGASLMMRGAALRETGLFDERFFLYYEEVDLCRRAAKAGWECWHLPQSRVVHLVGQSTGVTARGVKPKRRPAYWFEARNHYFASHHGPFYGAMTDIAWIAGHLIFRAREAMRKRRNTRPPRLLWDFISQGRFGAWAGLARR
jgi:N-acetylglucosaminyl-diphospho-decaprenol L-rhamnosyltransferase